jgi:hypothetical protein
VHKDFKVLKDHKVLKELKAYQEDHKVLKDLRVRQDKDPKVLKGLKVHKDLQELRHQSEHKVSKVPKGLLELQVVGRLVHKVLKEFKVHKVPKDHKDSKVLKVQQELHQIGESRRISKELIII